MFTRFSFFSYSLLCLLLSTHPPCLYPVNLTYTYHRFFSWTFFFFFFFLLLQHSYAHTGFVRGLTVDRTGTWLFSCGDDRTIKQFRFDPERGSGRHDLLNDGGGGTGKQSESLSLTGRDQPPVETWMSKTGGTSACNFSSRNLRITPPF